jgi:hypothetical protein
VGDTVAADGTRKWLLDVGAGNCHRNRVYTGDRAGYLVHIVAGRLRT